MSAAELATWPGALALLATYLLHSTLVIAAIWALQARAGARLRDWLWKAALLLPIATTGAHVAAITPSFAVSWRLPQLEASLASPAESTASTAVTRQDAADIAQPAGAAALPFVSVAAQNAPGEREEAATAFEPATWLSATLLWTLLLWALFLWALLLPGVRLRRLLQGARPIESGELFDDLDRLQRSAGLVRQVHLFEHDGLESPVAAGWLRRGIYLPPRVHSLDRPSRRALLAHELAHHARLDPVWSRLTHAVALALFFQPLNRVAKARTVACAELLADDLAVRWTGDGPGLARCLTEVAAWIKRRPRTSAAVAMVRSRHHGALRARIHRALDAQRELSALFPIPIALALSAAAWCALPSIHSGAPTLEAAYDTSASPYHKVLERLRHQLESAPQGAEDPRKLLRLRAELQQLHRAAETAMTQDS